MITDLVSMVIIQRWLQANAPEYVEAWSAQIPPQLPPQIGFAIQDLEASSPLMGATFLSQTCIPQLAIDLWKLESVALLGAGRPHIFSPEPNQILYYTDQVPDVLEASKVQGYHTAQVDVGNRDDYQKLTGAKVAIGTGIFHFFPDPIIQGLFEGLAEIGFTMFIFNHAAPDDEVHFQASAAHVSLYPRTPDQIRQLMTSAWTLELVQPMGEFIRQHPVLGEKLTHQPHRANVYKAVC